MTLKTMNNDYSLLWKFNKVHVPWRQTIIKMTVYSILFFNNSFQLTLLGWLSNMHNGVTKYLDVLPIEKKKTVYNIVKKYVCKQVKFKFFAYFQFLQTHFRGK